MRSDPCGQTFTASSTRLSGPRPMFPHGPLADPPGTPSAGTGADPGTRVPPPVATSSRRPTKAGAQTPATRAPLGQSHHARPRSTKAGAQAPATPIRKMCSHGNNLHAQRRPKCKLRRHLQNLSMIHALNHDVQLADGVAHTRKCAGGSCTSIVAFPNPVSLTKRLAIGNFRISGSWHARTAAPMAA